MPSAKIGHIHTIVVHHSASPRSVTAREIDRWHRDKGWSGIGYHFCIEEDGTIQTGRRLPLMGAHAGGFNRNSIGVCVTGDNTKYRHRWKPAQRRSLKKLIAALLIVFPGAEVRGHREVGTTRTDCPGTDLEGVLPRTRRT